MANKIPQHFIDDLLARTDIVALIERHIPLKKTGNSYQCLCPFHNDSKPSMHIVPHKQFYYCFSCGASGNAITFLMEYEHLSFLDTIDSLAADAGVNVPKAVHANENRLQPIFDMLMAVSQFYQQQLQTPQAQHARHYLSQRKLSEKTIEHFAIGYISDNWDTVLSKFAKSKESKLSLAQAGMLIEKNENDAYDRFRGRIMFPIRDQRGRVIAFGGRVLDNSNPKYLNSPETVVFHKGNELYGLYEARKQKKLDTLLVVEGYMDVISLYEHGIQYACATLGTAVTGQHVQRLLRTVKHIVFCFDGDSAGLKAAWKALSVALPQVDDSSLLQFLFLPQNEDPDSFIQTHGQAAFEQKITEAATLSQYLLDELCQQVNLETLEGRAQLTAKAMPYIQEVKATSLRQQLLQALAKLSHTPIDKLSSWQQSTPASPSSTPVVTDIKQTPVRFAITLILQYPECATDSTLTVDNSKSIKGIDVVQKLLEICRNRPHINTAGLLEYWRETPAFKYLNQLAASQLLIPGSSVKKELNACLKRIQQQAIEKQIDDLLTKANQGLLGDEDKQTLQKLLIYKKTGRNTTI